MYRVFSASFAGLAFLLASVIAPTLYGQEGPESQSGSSDSVSKPKKKPGDENPPPEEAPIPSEFKKSKEGDVPKETPTFRANATTVSVDVAVLDDHDHFIPTVKRDQFRVLEDGVPQQISEFGRGEAPMTICLVVEFSGRFQAFWSRGWYETLQASYGFLQTLKPDDAVAVVSYDMRTHIISDFSTDKSKAMEAMQGLRIPGFSESNIFDALTDMADRMSNVEGRKAILVIATGLDTFSRITFDQARKSLQESGVPIYSISILQIYRMMAEGRGMGPIQEMNFLQADNEMRTFAKETGGMAFFPRFMGEYPSVFRQIEEALRNEYSLSYHPTNTAKDGKFRHIKIELVNPETNEPLRLTNEKNKPMKYKVIAKAGYKAPREVE